MQRMVTSALAAVPETMSAQEAADYLGVVERTVRRWIETGDLPATKVGKAFSIRVTDVETAGKRHLSGRFAARQNSRDRDSAFAELQGRYNELRDTVARLESQLAEERRRSARLEIELELSAA
jgi:excisionase family DNA binding protein